MTTRRFGIAAVAAMCTMMIGACQPATRSARVQVLQEFEKALFEHWDQREDQRIADRLDSRLAPVEADGQDAQQRLTRLEEGLTAIEDEILLGVKPTVASLKRDVPRLSSASAAIGESIKGRVAAETKPMGDRLDNAISTWNQALNAQGTGLLAKLENLEKDRTNGASARQSLRDRLAAADKNSKDLQEELGALDSGIRDGSKLQVPVTRILDDWKGTKRIAQLENLKRYALPVVIVFAAGLLITAMMALGRRDGGVAREALRKAEAAEKAAAKVNKAVEAIRTEKPKPKTPASEANEE